MRKIFVYGTLKRNYGNNSRLRNAKFVEEAVIPGIKLFYSYSDQGFPVAKRDEFSSVRGEIWDISGSHEEDTLRGLDALEGNGYMYIRQEIVEGVETYIGHNRWDFHNLKECPSVNNVYSWDR